MTDHNRANLNRSFWYIIERHYAPSMIRQMEVWAREQEAKLLAANDPETRRTWGEYVAQGGSL